MIKYDVEKNSKIWTIVSYSDKQVLIEFLDCMLEDGIIDSYIIVCHFGLENKKDHIHIVVEVKFGICLNALLSATSDIIPGKAVWKPGNLDSLVYALNEPKAECHGNSKTCVKNIIKF